MNIQILRKIKIHKGKLIFLLFILSLIIHFVTCSKTPTDNKNNYRIIPYEDFNTIDTEPDWSPDGNRIAYTHLPQDSLEEINGPYQIWILYLDSMQKEFITMGYRPDWSPDGNKIAYVKNTNIYSIEIDTRQVTQLTDWGECFFPSWSPDGEKIVYAAGTNWPNVPIDSSGIWIMDKYGNNRKQLIIFNGIQPCYSPVDSIVLFVEAVNEYAPYNELSILNINNSSITRLTYNDFSDRHADWSQDGKYIAWQSIGKGNDPRSGVWVMNADGSSPQQLTYGGGNPSWSADGTQIVYYQQYNDSTGTLWIMNADGSEQQPLTTP